MLTTAPFSIRTYRGMGELDSPGTYRDRGVEGGSESRPRGRLRGEAPASPSGESGLAPPSDFFFSAGFLFIEKKKCKEPVDDGIKRF